MLPAILGQWRMQYLPTSRFFMKCGMFVMIKMLNSTLNLMSSIDLRNIHSLTDFKRNANAYVEQLQATQLPLVLTVNGKAAVVVQEAGAFQSLIDRIAAMETELQSFKLAQLRQDLGVGIEQLDRGQSTACTQDNLHQLFDEIRTQGRANFGQAT
jgi:prevent-host-death family protein